MRQRLAGSGRIPISSFMVVGRRVALRVDVQVFYVEIPGVERAYTPSSSVRQPLVHVGDAVEEKEVDESAREDSECDSVPRPAT